MPWYDKTLEFKPATVIVGKLHFFYCACCGSASQSASWNVKYCARPKCQERKRELAHSKKSQYGKRRISQGK